MSTDETAWVLERGPASHPQYACVRDGLLDWTSAGDHAAALRLSRRADAEALATIMEDADRVAQHQWHSNDCPHAVVPQFEYDDGQ